MTNDTETGHTASSPLLFKLIRPDHDCFLVNAGWTGQVGNGLNRGAGCGVHDANRIRDIEEVSSRSLHDISPLPR